MLCCKVLHSKLNSAAGTVTDHGSRERKVVAPDVRTLPAYIRNAH
jgi:hypothetical protein